MLIATAPFPCVPLAHCLLARGAAGCSDGGVHSLDVATGALSSPQRAEGGCHVAGVLTMDHSWSAGSLATGSEVRGCGRGVALRAGGAV